MVKVSSKLSATSWHIALIQSRETMLGSWLWNTMASYRCSSKRRGMGKLADVHHLVRYEACEGKAS